MSRQRPCPPPHLYGLRVIRLAAATALTTCGGAPAGATAVRPSGFMAIWAGGGGGSEEKPPEVAIGARMDGAGQQGGTGRGCGEPANGQGGLHGRSDSGFAFQSASEVS